MPNQIPKDHGWIEVIIGPMYSGKTSELIRRLTLAEIARQDVAVFKPSIDNRFSSDHIVSRLESSMPCVPIHPRRLVDEDKQDVFRLTSSKTVVGFDEAQFFHSDLVSVCNELARQGKRVIVAGLDSDYRRKPFETVVNLVSTAEYVDKMRAICVLCGNPAHLTKRTISSSSRVVIGDTEAYEVRCRDCFWTN